MCGLEVGLDEPPEELGVRQVEDQDAIAPTAVLLPHAQGQLTSCPFVGMQFFHPTYFSIAGLGVQVPNSDRPGHYARSLPVLDFARDETVSLQEPVDVGFPSTATVATDDSAPAMALVQRQDLLCRTDQLLQTAFQVDLALVKTLNYDFVIQGSRHTSQLTTTPVLVAREEPFCYTFPLTPSWHSSHIHIHDLQTLLVIVAVAAAVRQEGKKHSWKDGRDLTIPAEQEWKETQPLPSPSCTQRRWGAWEE